MLAAPPKELLADLIAKTIETLNFQHIDPLSVDPSGPLIGSDLGIDSIDILELVIMLEKDYGVKVETKEQGKDAFASFNHLARFVEARRISVT